MQQTNTYNFKVGDKVKVKPYSEFDFTDELYEGCEIDIRDILGGVFEILDIDNDGDLRLNTADSIDYDLYVHPNDVILVTPVSTKNPRKHAELIKQWADDDSLEIQEYNSTYKAWTNVSYPKWYPDTEYRIKPKTVTKWKWAYNSGQTDATILTGKYFADEEELKKYCNGKVVKAIKLDWTAKEFEV